MCASPEKLASICVYFQVVVTVRLDKRRMADGGAARLSSSYFYMVGTSLRKQSYNIYRVLYLTSGTVGGGASTMTPLDFGVWNV